VRAAAPRRDGAAEDPRERGTRFSTPPRQGPAPDPRRQTFTTDAGGLARAGL